MTNSKRTTATPTDVPTEITAVVPITVAGVVLDRGEVLTIDDATYSSTVDTEGRSILSMSERQQVETYGRIMWKVGNHSASIQKADQRAQEQRERTIDPDGALEALRSEWAAEDHARAAAKINTSRTTSGV